MVWCSNKIQGCSPLLDKQFEGIEKINFFLQAPELEIESLRIFSISGGLLERLNTQKVAPKGFLKIETRWL